MSRARHGRRGDPLDKVIFRNNLKIKFCEICGLDFEGMVDAAECGGVVQDDVRTIEPGVFIKLKFKNLSDNCT